jgi:hypothetical protein
MQDTGHGRSGLGGYVACQLNDRIVKDFNAADFDEVDLSEPGGSGSPLQPLQM